MSANKIILNIIFFGTLGMLFFALVLRPDIGKQFTNRVLGTLSGIQPATEVTPPSLPTDSSLVTTAHSYLSGIIRPKPQEQATATDVHSTALTTNSIVDATNQQRIAAGLPPLKLNPLLIESARKKALDMIAKQYFEHTSPTGITVSDLGRQAGYDYIIMGENLALGDFVSTNELLQAWMASPGHRANILNPNYEEIGAYAIQGMYQGREVWFAVQHFGTPRVVCPPIDVSLKSAIDTLNADLKQQATQIASDKATLEAANHPTGDAYKTMVDKFNALVANYNTELVISQEKISEYNAQVSAFNTCLAHYQSKSSS